MSRKITYRSKHLGKTAKTDHSLGVVERPPRIPIDPAVQRYYLEGKRIVINKPLHWTSFDVVRKLRNLLQIKKIGHAGTLDPLATGVLIVCTGNSTKEINSYMAQEKEYTGSFTLGAITDTYDLESEPGTFRDYSFVHEQLLNDTVKQFTGEIKQLPPAHSAVKKDGIASYELARKGIAVIREPRMVVINSFEITRLALPLVYFKVVCETGTYIRSLANDFGEALGCGAYLSSLCRTRIGPFTIEDALAMEEFETSLRKDS